MTDYDTEAERVLAKEFDRLRYNLMSSIEASVIEGHEERGLKNLVKSLSYEAQKDIREAIVKLAAEPRCVCPQ